MLNLKRVLTLGLAILILGGCTAAAVKPKQETSIGRAIFDVSLDTPSRTVVDGLYDSISGRADNLQKTVGFVSTDLPDKPGAPDVAIKNMGMGIVNFSLPQVTCNGAYSVMNGFDKGVRSMGLGSSDQANYTACIYPYRDAYRVYIVGTFMSSSGGGIGGLVADGIKKGVSGVAGNESIQTSWFNNIISRFRDNFPGAQEVEITMP